METEQLVRSLAADRRRGPSLTVIRWAAMAFAIAAAAAVFLGILSPRPDIAAAIWTPRFDFKFVVTLSLAVSSSMLLAALSRPVEPSVSRMLLFLVAPAVLCLGVVAELHAVPSGEWMKRLVGRNNVICLSLVPLIGLAPLASFLGALWLAAPTRPMLAGAVAGMLAGSVAATFYATHCPDDSPLFLAVWYSGAVLVLAIIGAAAGHRMLRW